MITPAQRAEIRRLYFGEHGASVINCCYPALISF